MRWTGGRTSNHKVDRLAGQLQWRLCCRNIIASIGILGIMLTKERKNGLSGNTVDENRNKSDNQKRRQRTQEALCTARSVWSRDG